MRPRMSLLLLLCASIVILPQKVLASDFGGVGLIKIPTARMARDGELRATISREKVADLYNVTYQATPWLEATFRYAVFNPRGLSYSQDAFGDRSYEVKARLLREGNILPEVALGVRDLLGTGVWEGEYFVASKKVNDFDLTAGLGWGRLGSRGQFENPLTLIDDRFSERPTEAGGSFGGESRSNSYFKGPVGWFGGVRYSSSRLPVSVLAEYNGDDYQREVTLNTLEKASPWNFAVEWKPISQATIALSWLHGSTLGVRFSSSLDTKSMPKRKRGQAFFSSSETRAVSKAPENLNLSSWYDRLLFDSERSGLRLNKATTANDDSVAILEIENLSYAVSADAINQALGLSEIHLPSKFKSVELLLVEENQLAPTVRYTRQYSKRPNRRELKQRLGYSGARDVVRILPPKKISSPTNQTSYRYPFISFGADFATRMQLMDPNAPFRKQLYLKLSSRVSLTPRLNLWAVYGQDIYNDFTTDRLSNSRIQKVRSDINKYLTEGESGIDQMFLEYRNSLGTSFHYRSYAGILEGMYAGIGSELLYEPFGMRWALGATINALKQRGYKKDFRFLDYQTVTGFMSFYYAAPWYDVDLAIHAGRYLARDKGMTFEARRTFDNGFSIGGFFTRTDLPAELFGEGSFDKGLFFKIPFNGILPGNSKNSYAAIMRPLERDGGRRLEDFSGSLWFARRNVRYDAFSKNKSRMTPQ